jgi:hypothetical protein
VASGKLNFAVFAAVLCGRVLPQISLSFSFGSYEAASRIAFAGEAFAVGARPAPVAFHNRVASVFVACDLHGEFLSMHNVDAPLERRFSGGRI